MSTPPAVPAAGVEVRDGTMRRLVDGRLRSRLHVLLLAELAVVAVLAVVAWHSRSPDGIDAWVARVLYARPGTRPRTIAELTTILGDPPVVVAGSVAVAAWAWWRFREVRLALFCPVAVGITSVVGHGLKLIVERPRPSTATLAHELDFSYPSGHVTGATALAVATVLLLAVASTRGRVVAYVVAAAFAVAVAVSRLALGVHFLSDVVAAALLGTGGVLGVGWVCSRGS